MGIRPGGARQVATKYIGSWFATIIDLIVILDATALALAICVTIGRGYFALGRDGLLPSVFAKPPGMTRRGSGTSSSPSAGSG